MASPPGAIDKQRKPIVIDSLYPAWQDEAKCNGVGNDHFFGKEDAESKMTMNIGQVRRAAKLCDTCPVFRECITQALMNKEEYGIWAGSTGKVRKHIRAMIARGDVTIPEVIEDYCRGETQKYRPPTGPARTRSARPASQRVRGEVGGEAVI